MTLDEAINNPNTFYKVFVPAELLEIIKRDIGLIKNAPVFREDIWAGRVLKELTALSEMMKRC